MEAFSAYGYKNSKLVTLSICKKYLQVITLGDIISVADGSLILPDIKKGNRPSLSQSSYEWPNQTSPNRQSWTLWRQALRNVFEDNGQEVKQTLRTSTFSHSSARTFMWSYNRIKNCLYHQLPNDQWQLYRLSIRRGRQPSNNVYF